MSLKGKIQIYGLTDTGLHRSHNEDTIGYDEDIALAVLADGMGGHRCGEIASAITVSTIMEFFSEKIKSFRPGALEQQSDLNVHSLMVNQAVSEAVSLANKNVFESAQANMQYRGMGTTVVALLFYDNHYTVAHVGDSRLYRLRDSKLEQITRDHSYTQELLDCGIYTPEQAKNSEHKNLITRAIGTDEKVKIDAIEGSVVTGDIYLLCSDGVSDMIDDELIESILIEHSDNLEKTATEIIRQANEHGGKDNISVMLAKTTKPFPAKNRLLPRFFNLFF